MKLLDALFYQYYRYTTKVLWDDEPFARTNFILSFSEASLVNGIIYIIAAKFFCFRLETWQLISVAGLILTINYFYYNRSGRSRRIVAEKPLLFDSSRLSIWITIAFFLVTISFLFWTPFYVDNILSKCK
jgi:uncharacterized membrane-anchored protein